MIIPSPNPIAFTIFKFPVYWYGIIMALALLVSILVANFICNKQNIDFKRDLIISYAPIIIICGVLGARLYFCLLNPSYYFANPLEILDIREGGLSIHGGLLGGILGLTLLSLKDKISTLKLLDVLACATFLGQAIGRWGNYFNSEAYGYPVSGQNWGLFIPETHRVSYFVNYSLFHPTFLYESLLDLLGFGILFLLLKKNGETHVGTVFFAYLVLYAIVRFFVENMRVDSALNIGTTPIAQIVSVVMLIFGVVGLCVLFIIGKNSKNS